MGAWVPVSCQAAGGSRAKRQRRCDWAAVTLTRSTLTLFCCGSVLCERNFSCLNWCQTIYAEVWHMEETPESTGVSAWETWRMIAFTAGTGFRNMACSIRKQRQTSLQPWCFSMKTISFNFQQACFSFSIAFEHLKTFNYINCTLPTLIRAVLFVTIVGFSICGKFGTLSKSCLLSVPKPNDMQSSESTVCYSQTH